MKRAILLTALVVAALISPACSSTGVDKVGSEDVIAGSSKKRTAKPAPERKAEPDGGVGDRVRAGSLAFRVFEVRQKDRIFAMAKPGADPKTRGDVDGEYVAIDYLTKNVSGSPLTTGAGAKLTDDKGDSYKVDDAIEPPSGGTDGMELGTGQIRASTMFFDVPNGIVPETLEIETRRGKARIDLFERNMDEVPPEDYLRVYHLYLNQQAYEEAYEMFDPSSVQDITLGEWLAFWEPRWGKQYVTLDDLTQLYNDSTQATYQITRTFYDRDGDIDADPMVDTSTRQEMTKTDGEWELEMDEGLVSDIIAVIGPDEPPVPEATTPEPTEQRTVPETTTRESTSSAAPVDAYDCTDFESQAEAQLYLAPGDPYALDEDGNGLACESLR